MKAYIVVPVWYRCGIIIIIAIMKAYIVVPLWYRCGIIIIIAVIYESLHCDTSLVPLW